MFEVTPEMAQSGGVLGLGIPLLWVMFKKFILTNKKSDADIATAQSYVTVIEQLREEADRLHESNKDMFVNLQSMMAENQRLSQLVSSMISERHTLVARIEGFEATITRLQSELAGSARVW